MSQLLFAAFGGQVGSAEAGEQESAAADRGGLVGVVTVSRESGFAGAEEAEESVVDLLVLVEGVPGDVVGFFLLTCFAVLEETALGEGAEADAENDCEC